MRSIKLKLMLVFTPVIVILNLGIVIFTTTVVTNKMV